MVKIEVLEYLHTYKMYKSMSYSICLLYNNSFFLSFHPSPTDSEDDSEI